MRTRNRQQQRSRSRLRLAAWILVLIAATPALDAQTVIEPGSAAGPTTFETPDFVSGGTCAPNLAGIFDEIDAFGNPIGQLGCLVPAAVPETPPGLPDKLQAATVSLLGLGPTKFRGTTYQTYDFEVSDSLSGRASAVPATVSVAIEVMGILAAVNEGRAGVEVSLEVFDITDGAEDAPLVSAVQLFEQEIAGTFEPGLGIDLGALLPVPDGEITVGASIEAGGEIAMVHEEEAAMLPVLLQRGHTYRVRIELESRAGVGLGGGLGLSSFYGPSGEALLWELLDIRDGGPLLTSLADLLLPGELNTEFSGPRMIIPSITFPGFDIGAASAILPSVSATVPSPSASIGGAKATFDKELPSPVPDIHISRSIGGTSLSLDPTSFSIPEHSISTSPFSFPGFVFPEQTLDLDPPLPMSSLAGLTERVNLPSFEHGFDPGTLLDWLEPVFKNARELSPLLDAIHSGPGVSVESLTVTMEEDVFEVGSTITSTVGGSETAILASITNAQAAMQSTLAGTEEDLATALDGALVQLTALVETEFLSLTTALEDWVALNLHTKIEDNLAAADADPVGTYMLPPGPPHDGLLDVVRAVVDETVQLMSLAGQNVSRAQTELGKGDNDFATGNYKDAYAHYRKAYQEAVK